MKASLANLPELQVADWQIPGILSTECMVEVTTMTVDTWGFTQASRKVQVTLASLQGFSRMTYTTLRRF